MQQDIGSRKSTAAAKGMFEACPGKNLISGTYAWGSPKDGVLTLRIQLGARTVSKAAGQRSPAEGSWSIAPNYGRFCLSDSTGPE